MIRQQILLLLVLLLVLVLVLETSPGIATRSSVPISIPCQMLRGPSITSTAALSTSTSTSTSTSSPRGYADARSLKGLSI